MNPLFLGALAYAATLMKGQKTADRLEYFPTNLEIINGKLIFSMDVLNPTKNPLKVDTFFGGVFAGSKKIGSIERGTPFILTPSGRTSVTFPVKSDPLSEASLLVDIIEGKKVGTVKVAGIARALGLDTAVTHEFSL